MTCSQEWKITCSQEYIQNRLRGGKKHRRHYNKSTQSEIEPADDYEYITINNFNTRTDMNTAQMIIDPETGGEYVGDVTYWGNAT